jgi:hypothetical protein
MSGDAGRPDAEIPSDLHQLHVPFTHCASHEFPARCAGCPVAIASMEPVGFE